MLLAEARAEIVRHARRLRPDGLVVGTAGNLSVRDGGLVAVTPSGVDYDELTPELIGVHRLEDGSPVEAALPPSSELPFHLAAYRATDAAAVVHTHSPAATAAACLDGLSGLPPIHYYTAMFGGPVRIAPYETYGSPELAAGVEAALADRRGCLLANHGAVTVGGGLAEAYGLAQQLEWMCDVYLRTRAAGLPRALDAEQLRQAAEKLAGYGRPRPRG